MIESSFTIKVMCHFYEIYPKCIKQESQKDLIPVFV